MLSIKAHFQHQSKSNKAEVEEVHSSENLAPLNHIST